MLSALERDRLTRRRLPRIGDHFITRTLGFVGNYGYSEEYLCIGRYRKGEEFAEIRCVPLRDGRETTTFTALGREFFVTMIAA